MNNYTLKSSLTSGTCLLRMSHTLGRARKLAQSVGEPVRASLVSKRTCGDTSEEGGRE